MRFKWEHYNNTHEALVDSWLDDAAVNFTGLDDGWKDFYDYWMKEAIASSNCKDYCFIVSENNEPFCIIYAATHDTEMTISECVVASSMRGKGYGSASIKELLDNCAMLVGEHIGVAKAVIYPNNTASQKAFEKAGFLFVSAHPNGDAWYYECPIHKKSKILLTAFEGDKNSSSIILNKVNCENVIKVFLPNEFDKSEELLISSINEYRPNFIISMGRKPQIKRLYVEPSAHNNAHSIGTTFDLDMLFTSLTQYGIAFRQAKKQSNYLCNHVYYCGLNYIQTNKEQAKMVFIHTPDLNNFENIDDVVRWLNVFCNQLSL